VLDVFDHQCDAATQPTTVEGITIRHCRRIKRSFVRLQFQPVRTHQRASVFLVEGCFLGLQPNFFFITAGGRGGLGEA
jgi:hypothetical protein